MNKVKWATEDFIVGFTLEKMERNKTFLQCLKYGIKSVIRG